MRNILKKYKIFDIDLYKLRSPNFHSKMLEDRQEIYETFSECLTKENDFRCILCLGNSKHLFSSWRNYRLYECINCGAISPNINIECLESKKFHEGGVVAEDLTREIISTYAYRKSIFAPERLSYIKDRLNQFGSTTGLLLDLGCGPGYFLDHLKEMGIEGRGLELNPLCLQICKNRGLNVSGSDLRDEPDEHYGLITMFDVLEHLARPVELLKIAGKKLTKNGYVLAYTPNIHSVSFLLMGTEHSHLAPFNHLCFYDKRSLVFLADKTGFDLVSCEFYGLDVLDFLSMKEAQDNHNYFERLRELVPVLQALIDSEGISNSMRIVFRKRS